MPKLHAVGGGGGLLCLGRHPVKLPLSATQEVKQIRGPAPSKHRLPSPRSPGGERAHLGQPYEDHGIHREVRALSPPSCAARLPGLRWGGGGRLKNKNHGRQDFGRGGPRRHSHPPTEMDPRGPVQVIHGSSSTFLALDLCKGNRDVRSQMPRKGGCFGKVVSLEEKVGSEVGEVMVEDHLGEELVGASYRHDDEMLEVPMSGCNRVGKCVGL